MSAALPRLFVALRPPPEVRSALLAEMSNVRSARWLCDTQLHLTLRFVGEIDPGKADDLFDALGRVEATRFTLSVSGVGHFERKGRTSALWAAIAPSPPLTNLQMKVERACQSVGLEAEHRKFTPHVTLARLNRSVGPVGEWLANHARLRTPPWPVERFHLFQSTLTTAGSEYESVAEWPLR